MVLAKPYKKRHFWGIYEDMPRFTCSRYSQPYVLDGSSNVAFGYNSTVESGYNNNNNTIIIILPSVL